MISNRNLEFFEPYIFMVEGSNHEFPMKKLGLALIRYIWLCGLNPVVVINRLVSGTNGMQLLFLDMICSV